MKQLRSRPVAWYIYVASLVVLLAFEANDWRRQVVAGPVARTQLVQVESLPPGSSLSIAPNVYASEMAWSPDSRLLAVPAQGDVVKLYDGRTGELIRSLDEGARDVAWSFDGSMLATADYEATAENPAGGQNITRIWSADGTRLAAIPGSPIAWANRSNRILIAPYDGGEHIWLNQLWEVRTNGQTSLLSEFEMVRWRLTVSPDDQWLVTVNSVSGPDEKLVVSEFESRRVVAELEGADMGYVESVAWSPDGAWLAASYDYNCPLSNCARLEIWNTATWKSHKTFGRQYGSSSALSWSPDSRWLVTTAAPTGWAITLYPLDDGPMIRELDQHLGLDTDVAWSPDGRKIASTTYDGQLTIWNAAALLP